MLSPRWGDAAGVPHPLGEMTTAHILNAQRYVRAGNGEFGPMLRAGCSGFGNREWDVLFETELVRRARVEFAAGSRSRGRFEHKESGYEH